MSDLGLLDELMTDEIGEFEGGNPPYSINGEVLVVEANKPTVSRETIFLGDRAVTVNTRMTLINPQLSSIALRLTQARTFTDRQDFNATVVAEQRLEFEIEGQWISLQDLVLRVIRHRNKGLTRTDTDILLDLRSYGFEPNGRLPMYLQHISANRDEFHRIADHFRSMGARDNTEDVRRRSRGKKSIVQMSLRTDTNVPISSIDINRSDRSIISNGFVGFADGRWSQFLEVLKLDSRRTAARRVSDRAREEFENGTNTTPLAEREDFKNAALEERRIADIFSTQTALRAFRNLGGVNVVADVLDENRVQYYANQVGAGRFSVLDPKGIAVPYNVWSTREQNRAQGQIPTEESRAAQADRDAAERERDSQGTTGDASPLNDAGDVETY